MYILQKDLFVQGLETSIETWRIVMTVTSKREPAIEASHVSKPWKFEFEACASKIMCRVFSDVDDEGLQLNAFKQCRSEPNFRLESSEENW